MIVEILFPVSGFRVVALASFSLPAYNILVMDQLPEYQLVDRDLVNSIQCLKHIPSVTLVKPMMSSAAVIFHKYVISNFFPKGPETPL